MDDNNIIIRITTETDLSDAQTQIGALTDRNKELTAQLKRLQEQEKADAQTIEATVSERERLSAKLAENAKYYKRERGYIEKDIAAGKQNIKMLQQSVNQYNALSGAGARTRTQLMALREELIRMAEAGDTTSERFIQLADEASALSDTIGDAQSVISLLASDTKNLDAAMQVGGGLVGTFNAATAAMALLGGESEELQQAFLKVQAAIALLNGVQQVMNVLDKRSAANVVIRTAAIKLLNKVKGEQVAAEAASAATTTTDTAAQVTNTTAVNANTVAIKAKNVAMTILNKTMLANPVMWLIAGLAALAAGITLYASKVKKAKDETETWNKAMKGLEYSQKTINKQTEYEAKLAEAQGKSWEEVWQIRKDYAQQYLDEVTMLKNKVNRKWNETHIGIGKWTEEDEKNMDEIYDKYEDALEYIRDLQRSYEIKKAADKTAYNNKRKELEEQAVKDSKAAAEQADKNAAEMWEKELKRQEEKLKAKEELIAERKRLSSLEIESDKEDDDVASYQSVIDYNTKRMQLDGATEDRIYQYRYEKELAYWQMKLQQAEFGSQEYMDIQNKIADMEINNNNRVMNTMQDKQATVIEIAKNVLQTLGSMATEIFGAISDNIQAQIDALDDMYTTDAEEAKQDANKKYLSEKELEEKKAKLKLRQQKLDKANAIFQIGLSTAMAIMSIWAQVPKVDFGATTIALTATAAALGATQLAIAAAKPLSQYEKGRKGGEGEYALVGEKGPEVMYVPKGASIIPNNKIDDTSAWGAYGVPQIPIPASTNINNETITQAVAASKWTIDYTRLGEAVAKALPKQRAVNVSIDRSGISIQNGSDKRTYLNTKYQGAW